jgi:hypothetical protein
MAVWSMTAMWAAGSGFWTPLNLVAHTFYRAAPLDAAFSAPALVIGLAIHMTVAGIFGTAIALAAQRMPNAPRSVVIAGGILFIVAVWPLMQWEIWYRIDEAAAEEFTGWIFAVAHLMFGITAAGFATIAVSDDQAVNRGRHAAGHPPSQPDRAPGSLFQPHGRSDRR